MSLTLRSNVPSAISRWIVFNRSRYAFSSLILLIYYELLYSWGIDYFFVFCYLLVVDISNDECIVQNKCAILPRILQCSLYFYCIRETGDGNIYVWMLFLLCILKQKVLLKYLALKTIFSQYLQDLNNTCVYPEKLLMSTFFVFKWIFRVVSNRQYYI